MKNKDKRIQLIEMDGQIIKNDRRLSNTTRSNSSFSPSKKQMNRQQNGDIGEQKQVQGQNKSNKKRFSWSVWRKLFQYSLKRKCMVAITLAMSVLYSIVMSLLPLKIGQVLDLITTASEHDSSENQQKMSESINYIIYMVLSLAVLNSLRYMSVQFWQQFIIIDMRTDIFQKFIQKDISFFEKYKSGELVSRLSSDVEQAKSAISHNLAWLTRNSCLIVSNLLILFTISWKLTFLIIFIVPLYGIITRYYSRRKKILVREHQDVKAEQSANLTQKFSGINLVKAYSTEKQEFDAYNNLINKAYDINKKKIYITAVYQSCSQYLPYIAIVIVLWYGGKLVMDGSSQLTAGQLTSFILYCTSLANSTSNISNSYTSIINGTYAVQKVFQMLDYESQVIQTEGHQFNISGNIQFDNVTFQYPTSTTQSLRQLSFRIQAGQYVAFVGESGSGKSTIIKLIQKFYKLQSGNIFFGPHNQNEIKATYLRKQIGMVNQQATIFSGTVQSNITYGLVDYNLQEMELAAEKAGCMEFLKDQKRFPQMFLSDVGQKGNYLSGGQRQRIAIARALLRRPKIIIFDQATSALDANSQQMVQESIQNLAMSNGNDKPTIIVIAHRLSTVINADRIFVMRKGQLVQSGSHNQLLKQKGYYYQLIEKQLSDPHQRLNIGSY